MLSKDEILSMIKHYCDQLNVPMPEDRNQHQMTMTRMLNIGLLTEDECITYIHDKFGEKDTTNENRSDL